MYINGDKNFNFKKRDDDSACRFKFKTDGNNYGL